MVENIVVHLKYQEEWDEFLNHWNPLGWSSTQYMEYDKYDSLFIKGDTKNWKIGAIASEKFFKERDCRIVTLQEAYNISGIKSTKNYELW